MKCKKRLSFVVMVAVMALAVIGCSAGFASAQDYSKWPEQDIRILYYTKAGSGGDMFLRQLAAALDGKLNGHKIFIENIIDQTGRAAWSRAQKAKPDGYTLAGLSTTVVTADLVGNSPVKYKDFEYVIGLGLDPQYVYCKSGAPFNTLAELIDYCKKNPGKIRWATSTPTSASTLCTVSIVQATGINVNRMVYQTGSDILVAMLGDFVDVAVGEYADISAQVEAKEIKLIALLAEERNSLNIPTAKEQGFDFVFDRARGLAAPKGTDPELVKRIYEVFAQAYDNPQFMDYLKMNAIDPVMMDGAEFLRSYDAIAEDINETFDALIGTKAK